MRLLKLIWDFRGPAGAQTAVHHEIHLKEYAFAKALSTQITGVENLSELHSIAYLVVKEDEMRPVRDALKPHRGQVYTEK
ncbi:hypothetical protein [uncultured Dokdonia sp.]|uniref:hypothetical protein n=1 Tax=uncultured Dokdonia sp. TaxID=575653 RepID=UPI0026229761|nr:hypothetical protein [uncultured Dokdonia sp.]